ncbi:FkbM family methyltransferase [Candidatus Parcubacteria bacterium]|nr:FkbM family methyltransferase [Candidatus Parcubacteria bacterium]
MYFIKKLYSDIVFALLYGATFFSKVKIVAASFLFPFKRIFKLTKPKAILVTLKVLGKVFHFYITDSSDLAVLKEVFLYKEYVVPEKDQPHIIFDIGSHVGVAALYFHLIYPQAKIFAFEPDPQTFRKLEQNTKQFPEIQPFNMALSNKEGISKFFIYPGSTISSSLIKRQDNQKSIMVPIRTLESVMKQNTVSSIDLIKFDVEGSEYELLRDFIGKYKPKMLIGEVHLDLMSVPEQRFIDMFNGYTIIKKPINKYRYIINVTQS